MGNMYECKKKAAGGGTIPLDLLWESTYGYNWPNSEVDINLQFDTSKYTHIVIENQPSGKPMHYCFFEISAMSSDISTSLGPWGTGSSKTVIFKPITGGIRVEIYSGQGTPHNIYACNLPFVINS